MQLTSTSTQRTYRYVRLSILGAVLVLFVSLIVVTVDIGPIASISAALYTPGRSVFVGALFAVTLALVALSGRSIQQALLDIAALCAPLIAIVPTPIRSGDVPGLVVDCPDPAAPCIPASEVAGIANGMVSLLVLAACALVTAVVIARVQRTLSPGVAVALGVAAVLLVATSAWWIASPASFLDYGHLVATSTFFGLIALVAAIAAFTSAAPWRACYAIIAAGIAVDIAFLVTVIVLRLNGVDVVRTTGIPFIFVGEALAVLLFAAFWVLQTVQLWDDTDPAIISPASAPRAATG